MEIPPPPGSSIFKQRWAELIKKVYEADPLPCTRCGGAMRNIAFIDQPEVIEKILTHLGRGRIPLMPRHPARWPSQFAPRGSVVSSIGQATTERVPPDSRRGFLWSDVVSSAFRFNAPLRS